jgi:hypothetical protein
MDEVAELMPVELINELGLSDVMLPPGTGTRRATFERLDSIPTVFPIN